MAATKAKETTKKTTNVTTKKVEEQTKTVTEPEVVSPEEVNEDELNLDEVEKILEDVEKLLKDPANEDGKTTLEPNWWEPKVITVRELITKAQSGFLNFQTAYQRKMGVGVWGKPEHVDQLLDSIMHGWFISTFLWRVDPNKTNQYDIVDSLQRTTAIMRIVNPNLPHVPRTLEGDYEHLNGTPFDAWSNEDQQRFLQQRILLVEINEDEDENIFDFFVRINKGGQPLTTSEAKRAKYLDKAKILEPFNKYPFWPLVRKNVTLNQKETTYMKLYNSLYEKTPDHASRTLVDWFIAFDMKTSHVEDLRNRLNMFDRIVSKVIQMNDGEKIAKRFCKPTHMSTIIPLLNESTDVQKASEILHEFYGRSAAIKNGNEEARKYKQMCTGSTASSESIRKRKEFMSKLLAGAAKTKVA